MRVRSMLFACAAVVSASALAAIDPASALPGPGPSATQIVEKNVAARGGLEAWRRIRTMVWNGHIDSPRGPMPSVPFVLAQKRPNMTRFEMNAMGQKTQRLFDGTRGWKVRAKDDGSPDVQPFTAQETRYAREGQGIDGLLIDCEAKGSTVTLEGTDQVEGRSAYRLNVRLASGQSQRVWVDANTFLDLKSERTAYNAAGMATGTVAVFYRDYKEFEGLQIPTAIETGVGRTQGSDRMVIEKVQLDLPLEDRAFTRAEAGGRQRGLARAFDSAPRQRPMPPAQSTTPAAAAPDSGSGSR
jgi:hypothetical protein